MKTSPYEVYSRAKERKEKRLEKSKRLKIRKPSLAKLKAKLWGLLSPAIKARYGSNCYSCGAGGLSGSNWQTGHLWSAGGHSLVRFCPKNLRPQCFRCNVSMRGNIAEYAANYIRAHGLDAYMDLSRRASISHKWTPADIEILIEKIKISLEHYEGFYEEMYGRT